MTWREGAWASLGLWVGFIGLVWIGAGIVWCGAVWLAATGTEVWVVQEWWTERREERWRRVCSSCYVAQVGCDEWVAWSRNEGTRWSEAERLGAGETPGEAIRSWARGSGI